MIPTPEILCCHDLDCWQNVKFDCPKFKDVGIARYSNKKYNGGVVFWKDSSIDIIDEIVNRIVKNKEEKEEPTLNKVLKSDKFKDRVTIVDNGMNVGCSGWVERFRRSEKPIKICHFHPYNRLAWETHVLDRNQIGERSVGERLEKLLRKYYNLATELNMTEEEKKIKLEKYGGPTK